MAPQYQYECKLTQDQRQTLEELVSRGMHNAREIRRARILLLCDCSEGGPHHARKSVAQLLGCTEPTVTKTIKRFAQNGLEDALLDRPRSGQPLKVTPKVQAQITAIACQHPPEGHSAWTLALIRDQFLILSDELDDLSLESVRKVLKKIGSNPG